MINRNEILGYAKKVIKQIQKKCFVEIEYEGEEGTGLGPTLEFFDLVANEIRGMRVWGDTEDHCLFPRAGLSEEEAKEFVFIGSFVAKAVCDQRMIDLPISSLFWDLVIGNQPHLTDIKKIDSNLYKSIKELDQLVRRKKKIEANSTLDDETKERSINSLLLESGGKVEDLCLYFTLPGTEIELKPEGKDLAVTLENLEEYLGLILQSMLIDSIYPAIQAFRTGFNKLFSISSLRFFHPEEIEDFICGNSDESEWKMENLLRFTEPKNGY